MNTPVYVFDNIGCFFTLKDNSFYCYQNIPGYKNLSSDHVGSYIPYIVRNASADNVEWETGIGLVKNHNDKIVVERYKVSESSNNNEAVKFSNNGKKTFYVFANEYSFNTGFNNVIVRDGNFDIENVKCVYLVDTSSGEIIANLPEASDNKSLIVELKTIAGDGIVNVNYKNNLVTSLRGSDKYLSLVCDGETWVVLNSSSAQNKDSFSSLSNSFSSLSAGEAAPPTGSFQYNNNGTIDGSNIYWGANNKLLLGSNSEASAQTILPSSGNFDNVFNKQKNVSNFIIHGSGIDKNLYFAYDGRLGLNIPSGSSPQTLLHLVNTSCRQAIRVENRTTCTTPNITLFHKPPSVLSAGGEIGSLTFSARDNATSPAEVSYAKLSAKAVSASAGSTVGEFVTSVENNGSFVETLRSNPTGTRIGYSNNNITVSNNGNINLTNNNTNLTVSSNAIAILSSGVSVQTPLLNVIGFVQAPSGSVSNLTVSTLQLSSLVGPSNLAVNSSGQLVLSSGFSFPAIPSGRVLTTSNNGAVTGTYEISDFFLTNKDISWSRYPLRESTVCVKQVVFTSEVPIEEFEVGDQIAIIDSDTTYFRTITDRDVSSGSIASLLINQNIPTLSTTSYVQVYSVTRGGVFLIEPYIDPSFGVVADSTSNIISSRPGTDTIFNTKQKDIDFYVYGTSSIPAITVKAKYGSEIISSGIYNEYATLDTLCETNRAPFPMNLDSNGSGLSNVNNTANFKSIAIDSNWSGMVSVVGSNGQPSYYGTYDQNGNVAEWVEDSDTISSNSYQYVAGGSWSSDSAVKLKSIESLYYGSGYNNVGFRISSSYGLLDLNYITGVLKFNFINVGNTNNISDTNDFYEIVDNNANPIGIAGLGSVSRNYRISKYEVTNDQYAKFLNSVNKTPISGLYDTRMTSSYIGGINISGSIGSYSYSSKSGMNDMPVTFVNYLSSLRFTNWLHNGAPTGYISDVYSIVNSGAYNIAYEDLNETSPIITKNSYQQYWIPSLDEWHKAAYYRPTQLVTTGDGTVVLINATEAYTPASGETSALTVGGRIYGEDLTISDLINTTTGNNVEMLYGGGHLSIGSGTKSIITNSGLSLNNNSVILSNNQLSLNSGTINISTTGVLINSSGTMIMNSPFPLVVSGISAQTITTKELTKIDDNGDPLDFYPGQDGAFLYKDLVTKQAVGYDGLLVVDDGGYEISFPEGRALSPLYVNENNYIRTYSGVQYEPDNATFNLSVKAMSGIQIGEDNTFLSGAILTHNGEGNAYWQQVGYLNADGVQWTRYQKRPVLIYEDKILFQDGDVETLSLEFLGRDTIAVINRQTLETKYIKPADGYFLIDGPDPVIDPEVFDTDLGGQPIMRYCGDSTIVDWISEELPFVSGYAFSVTRGAYMSMQLEPDATEPFSCDPEADLEAVDTTFKPSTSNTISIRPEVHTAFNQLGENIDFVVYGNKNTLYHKYDPEIFGPDDEGLPAGLVPAFRIHAEIPNSVSGTIESGVIYSGNIAALTPYGFNYDEKAKLCINTNNPYVINSIPTGSNTLALYADLTVNSYLYASGIITNAFSVPKTLVDTNKYIVNAPLTVNASGLIVSQVPTSTPTQPDAPTGLTVSAGYGSVNLSWVPPASDGGKPILNYRIEYTIDNGTNWIEVQKEASTNLYYTVENLANSVAHKFRVYAINSVGTGPSSSMSSAATPNSSVPSLVRGLLATKQYVSSTITVTLSWSIPSINAGTITDYTIEISDNYGLSWSQPSQDTVSTSTSLIIPGLSNSAFYLFRVKAVNSSGSGGYSVVSVGDATIPTDTNDSENIWDFGKVRFSGVCI